MDWGRVDYLCCDSHEMAPIGEQDVKLKFSKSVVMNKQTHLHQMA